MKLSLIPNDVLTNEAAIVYLIGEFLREQEYQGIEPKAIEAEGFYASNFISVTPIDSVDAGHLHVIRIMVPVSKNYYGDNLPTYQSAGEMFKSLPGMNGILIPGSLNMVRFNPSIANGTVEFKTPTGNWTQIGTGSNLVAAWIGADRNIYGRNPEGDMFSASPSPSSIWNVVTLTNFTSQVTASSAIRL